MDSPPLSSAPPAIPQKSGSGKKWVLFGCGGCLGLLVLAGVAGWFFVSAVLGVIKADPAYQTALKRTRESPEMQAELGEPIKDGFMMNGSINTSNGQGIADFTFPVSGPKGEGTVTVKAAKPPGGTWEYSILQVKVTGSGKVIDLRTSAEKDAAEQARLHQDTVAPNKQVSGEKGKATTRLVDRSAGERVISGSHWTGATSKEVFEKLSQYLEQGDGEAYSKLMAAGLATGDTTIFKDGEEVLLADTALFSGLIKLRRKGDLREYWTNLEATK